MGDVKIEVVLGEDEPAENSDSAVVTSVAKVLSFAEFKINKDQYLDYYYNNPEKAFCKNKIEPKLKKLMSMFAKRVDNSSLKL